MENPQNPILKAHLGGVEMLDKIHFISEPNSVICPRCKTIYPASPVKGSFKLNTHCQKCVENKSFTYKHNQTGEVFMEHSQEYHTSELLLPEQYYKLQVKSFLTTYAESILNAAKEEGPEKKWTPDMEESRGSLNAADARGHNKCLTSFHSAIDEGIKEIKGNENNKE